MSGRPFVPQTKVITNESMGASVTSEPTILNQMSGAGYDVSWTGTPTGTFSVEISNTIKLGNDRSIVEPGNWTAVTLSAPITASGSADNAFINLAGLQAYAVRLKYTRTSGTGTLNAVICAKVQ